MELNNVSCSNVIAGFNLLLGGEGGGGGGGGGGEASSPTLQFLPTIVHDVKNLLTLGLMWRYKASKQNLPSNTKKGFRYNPAIMTNLNGKF